MQGIIIYKGKYGATRQYAQWLGLDLSLRVVESEDCTARDIEEVQVVILGSSVYIGKLQLSSFLKKYEDILRDKELLLFVVSATAPDQKEKLEEYISNSVPASIAATCYRYFLPGRMIYGKLSWKDKFLLKMGAWLSGSKKTRKEMLSNFDKVSKSRLGELMEDAGIFLAPMGEAV